MRAGTMQRANIHRAIGLATIAPLAIFAASCCLAEPPNSKTMRLYANGPLTRADYSSKPVDAPVGFGALTDTQLRYHAEYDFILGPTGATCQVKKLIFYAVLNPKTTWADPNRIDELLDHEQGHFDITYKHALLAKKDLEPKVAKRQLRAVGLTPEQARDALAKRLEKEIAHYAERGVAENKAYDESTRHGTLAEAQAEWRARQSKEIEELRGPKAKKASAKKPAEKTKEKVSEEDKARAATAKPKSAP
jgi:hypothetical protein